jgi:sugar lactone lactonase YvrE
VLFICCTPTQIITELFVLPKSLKETSGVEITPKSGLIWTLEDSGNKPELYALDQSGKIVRTLRIEGVNNIDWEDLASDKEGNLYIGDFGNNDSGRNDLAIYMISVRDLDKDSAPVFKKFSFFYPEQTEFPPKKNEKFYDAEAFFVYKNSFYIFTKNRTMEGADSRLYRIAAIEGNHPAEQIGTFATCDSFRKCAITGADISNDGKKVALLSNRKVWLIEKFKKDRFLESTIREIDLGNESQLEGVCFKSNSKLYLVDERDKHSGGKLYELKL